jgi:hypothetical protein
MHWNGDSEDWLEERVAAWQRLLLDAEAVANVACRRRHARKLRRRHALAGRDFALAKKAALQKVPANVAAAESQRPVVAGFRN